MKSRTAIVLVVLAVLVGGASWLFGRPGAEVANTGTVATGSLIFPDLAGKLASAARVEITSKGATLAIARGAKGWGLADRAGFPVQADKLRELLTGLTEARITEPRTADASQFERLGVGDPSSPTSTGSLIKLLDDKGNVLAQLIVGHRRVRTQGNVPETIYVRHPGEDRAWLAEGSLPADADPQLWFDRDIANIDHGRVAKIEVDRGAEHLVLTAEGDTRQMVEPAEHPKLDDYSIEEMFRSLETLTLTDVRPVAERPGDALGTTRFTLTDGTVISVAVFGYANPKAEEGQPPEVWTQYAVQGDSAEAKALAAKVDGWAYQVGGWKEKSFVPLLDALKAEEKGK